MADNYVIFLTRLYDIMGRGLTIPYNILCIGRYHIANCMKWEHNNLLLSICRRLQPARTYFGNLSICVYLLLRTFSSLGPSVSLNLMCRDIHKLVIYMYWVQYYLYTREIVLMYRSFGPYCRWNDKPWTACWGLLITTVQLLKGKVLNKPAPTMSTRGSF